SMTDPKASHCSSPPPFQTTRTPPEPSRHRGIARFLCRLSPCPQAEISAPVHSLRSFGECREDVRASAESHPDLLRLPQGTVHRRFLLARVGQTGATPTSEDLT